ncbi:hypothetical protein JA1_000040 [Spathaspora sp. JA1]|nr:hypothetical protein JA1_000040 [Spathaspora sp. JA1]
MPPKKTTNSITILKFKSSQITYTIPFLTITSLEQFKQELADAINNSGGIQPDEPVREQQQEVDDEDEENIPVPKSEFIEEDDEQEQVLVKIEQLRIAVPRDLSAPYDNQWLELDDSSLSKIKFKDYNILAFSVNDEPFEIVEAAYEEEE